MTLKKCKILISILRFFNVMTYEQVIANEFNQNQFDLTLFLGLLDLIQDK